MNALRRLRLHARRGDAGIALVFVIGIGSVLALLVVAGVSYTIGGMKKSSDDEDWNAALAAAYAGVEEYQSQIASDPSYVRFGNPASAYTAYVNPAQPTVVSNVTLPPITNDAFGIGTSGTWETVASSGGEAQFRYEVNNAKYFSDGIVTLRATGRVGDTTRSIVADLKQSGFVDYVYFTDLETVDPYNDTSPCNRHAHDSPARPASCTEIQFGSSDLVDGPAHSNDTIVIACGATFTGAVTTAYNPPTGDKYKKVGSSCTPNFADGIPPKYEGTITMPPTNSEMKKEVRYDLPSEVPNPGCLYTGPTSIVFTDDGYMQVTSPWTLLTQVAGSPVNAGRTANSTCGAAGTGSGQLGHSNGARVKVPNNNMIFVQNVPSVAGVPNYRSASTTIGGCSGTVNRNSIGYPKTNESAPTGAYQCRNGDVFIKGKLDGKVTVAADNIVYVVDDVEYDDDTRDVLGLVGQNAVIVWNPVKDKDWHNGRGRYEGDCISGYCETNRTIEAAILSVSHTFTVQNYDVDFGYRGTLTLKGSIAQKFRGVVRQYSGYNKDYHYDTRFKYTAPPKFLTPASTTYGVSTWVEVSPAVNADGTYR